MKIITNINYFITKLMKDEIIAYPTESVFGLGCNPESKKAVMNLLALKQRSIEKGFILVAANYEQIKPYIHDHQLSKKQRDMICSQSNSTRPITWLLPKNIKTPSWLTGNFSSLAVRISKYPSIKQLCTAFNKPLISTSANITGSLPCRTVKEIRAQFGKNLLIYPGNLGPLKFHTEIRDLLSDKIIRYEW
ncbi:MAG: Sua5/YciO/YrdC/YwlC family protein [Candidatus Dasytiphilus stammeri]